MASFAPVAVDNFDGQIDDTHESPDTALPCSSNLDDNGPHADLPPQGDNDTALESHSKPAVPVSPPLATHLPSLPGCRFFLDICSGATRPLSQAVWKAGGSVLSFDILLNGHMDLLNDDTYEQLLKIAASGQVAYGAASPSCGHYSRLKLRNDFDPGPLRTPEFLSGVPNLGSDELAKVQESHLMLIRCVVILSLVFQAGGHVHLEQPPSAMSWLELEVQQFLLLVSASCTAIPACLYGANLYKSWLFASSFQPLASLGGRCPHGANAHVQIAGRVTPSGDFTSRQTACYPDPLATAFAEVITPLLSGSAVDIQWSSVNSLLTMKGVHDPPFSSVDGGGIHSSPDWSRGDRIQSDMLRDLRQPWLRRIVDLGLHQKIQSYFSRSNHESPPFSEVDLQPFREDLQSFLLAHNQTPDWSIRPHQPMALRILSSLSAILQDPDTSLFDNLIAGVPTGFEKDIPRSYCFPVHDKPVAADVPLTAHLSNWTSAENDLPLTRQLVEEEISQGWVLPFDGDLAAAQDKWPIGLSLGKLGIAAVEGRAPRLVLDNTICGLNDRCRIPEASTLPSAKDVLRSYPIRNSQSDVMAFSIDIKAAHKRIVLREEEWGLVGFSLDQKLYFYRVAPFGAAFSAHWWSRLGGFFLRLFHYLLWLSHVGFLYVDDFLLWQDHEMMPCSAAMICILCQLTCIPVSWKKCELAPTIKWIGWVFHIHAGFVEIPADKLQKLLTYIKDLRRSSRTTKKLLEKFIGLAMWLTQLWPYMRIWLHHLYRDLYQPPLTNFSIDYGDWPQIFPCLSDTLIFTSRPPGTAIPIGSQLYSVRHQVVKCKTDLRDLRLSDKRIWMRVRDHQSTRRSTGESSQRVLSMFEQWLFALHPLRPLRPKQYWYDDAAADACAARNSCQIGGFVRSRNIGSVWFSERFTHDDFQALNLDLDVNMQRSISCFEALAQIALLFCASRRFPGHRFPVCIKSLSDNTGAEAGSNKMFSMSRPMCFFLEKLCLLAAISGMELDVHHIPGPLNILADDLSRWDGSTPVPGNFLERDRIRISLSDLWISHGSPAVFPADYSLPWVLPTRTNVH